MKVSIEIDVADEQELRDLGDALDQIVQSLRRQEKGFKEIDDAFNAHERGT